VILPSCPFPPISWYHLAYKEDSNALIEVHENYVKQSIRNRILLANSQGVWDLTIPVHRRNAESRLIEDIVFTDQMDPVFLMKNIKTAYGSAPFYEHFENTLLVLFNSMGNPGQSLLNFNLATIKWVESELGIQHIEKNKSYSTDIENDYRKKGLLISDKWGYTPYPQVFEDRNGFIAGRSILDAIFHGGPEAKKWWANVSLRT